MTAPTRMFPIANYTAEDLRDAYLGVLGRRHPTIVGICASCNDALLAEDVVVTIPRGRVHGRCANGPFTPSNEEA